MVEIGDSPSSKPIRVLHLDDESELNELTKTFLERETPEFEVVTESSPSTALERIESEEIDGIISDYDMPEMNGLEFLDSVREEHPNLPFILFTGKGSEEIASEAISRGVTDYLQKGTGTDQYTVLANRIQNAVRQYRAEREVEERSEWYSRILEHSSDYVLIVNSMGNVRYVSPAIERVMGYTQDEIIGDDALAFVHPDDIERAADSLAVTIENPDNEVTVEFRAEAKDGSIHWLEVRGSNLLDDRLIDGVMVNVRDITQRKQREQELQRQEAFLDHSTEVITVLDEDGTITFVSPSVERVLGYGPEELYGENGFELVHPDYRDDVERAFQRLLNEPENEVRAEFRYRTADGEWCWLDALGTNQSDDPVIDGIVVTSRDITDRKEHEQEIERQNERLDEFVSVVSHDLRNPLTVAEGRLELASRECDSEHLDAVARAHERMNELIDNLLSLAQSGKPISETEPVALDEVARTSWQNVATSDATLAVETDLVIQAERSQLRRLAENLFRNAVEHGGEDVTVRLGVLDDRSGFYVEDDGSGIPEDDREQVFEKGYSTVEGGTGFGLSIVSQVASAHGWETRIAEGADGGAKVTVTGVEFVDS